MTTRTLLNSSNTFYNNATIYSTSSISDIGKLSLYYWYTQTTYQLQLYVDWVVKETIDSPVGSSNFSYRRVYFNTKVWWWHSIELKMNGSSWTAQCNAPKLYFTPVDNANWPHIIINTVKNLWEFLTGIIYGRSYDNDYIGGIMLGKENNATTGSITLWNAVWYIKVRFNGEYIKIPYYWD